MAKSIKFCGFKTCNQGILTFPIPETKVLAKWVQSIVNRFYWSISTCNGNGKELVERFVSVKHHIVNRHKFELHVFYKECAQPPLDEKIVVTTEWLAMGTEAHEALCKIISEATLLPDMEHVTFDVNTALLEVFHSLKIRYLPKSIFYRMEKMIAGTEISTLDYNNNILSEQV